jgi:hypothetical protein
MFHAFIDRMRPIYRQAVALIPPEHQQRPPLRISSAVIEESAKCVQEDELHFLFANLLAAASDDRRVNEIQPGFAEAIGQLTPVDAKIVRAISSGNTLGWWYAEHTKVCSRPEFEVSAANLIRLGIAEWVLERPDTWLESHVADDFGRVRIKTASRVSGAHSLSIGAEADGLKDAAKQMAGRVKDAIEKSNKRAGIQLTQYGKLFVKACVVDLSSASPDESTSPAESQS